MTGGKITEIPDNGQSAMVERGFSTQHLFHEDSLRVVVEYTGVGGCEGRSRGPAWSLSTVPGGCKEEGGGGGIGRSSSTVDG
jgi:hypothetical protein